MRAPLSHALLSCCRHRIDRVMARQNFDTIAFARKTFDVAKAHAMNRTTKSNGEHQFPRVEHNLVGERPCFENRLALADARLRHEAA
jgi:hypothetical protein